MNLLKNIPCKHGFYDLNGDEYLYPNDKYISADTYETEDISIYVHKDNKTATMVLNGFKYDKCSKAFLKRGGILTVICRNHDGWFGAEYLSFFRANLEMFFGMKLLKQVLFKRLYHFLFVLIFGYPFRFFQEKFNGAKHDNEEIKKNRRYVRLFKLDEKKIWRDVSQKQKKWNGEEI